MIPTCVTIAIENAAGTDNWVSIGFDTADLYTSGGDTVLTTRNLRTDAAFGSTAIKACSGVTAIVMLDPAAGERMFFHWVDAFAATPGHDCGFVKWEPRYCPVLVGPATLFAYVYGSSAPDIQFTAQWVEFESEALPE